jgi:hypothetical protein
VQVWLQIFSVVAQIFGQEQVVTATNDGTGIQLETATSVRRAATLQEAIRLAREELGRYLRTARHPAAPWGLRVFTPCGNYAYGDWLFPGAPAARPSPPSALDRIRKRWREGSDPHSALENALEIARACAGKR